MSFLAPFFLVSAVTAAVPIVLHLLKREPEPRIKFAAVRLLERAPVERAERRHLRQLLLLILRVSALVLLAIAFARPFFTSSAAAGAPAVTMVVLDTSYSLMAPGRFERAQSLAKNAVARAPAGDLVGVVAFSDEAQTLVKPSANRRLASAAIDRAAVSFGATRYSAGFAAAAANLDGRRATIVVVTDLQENGWDQSLEAGPATGSETARASVPASASIEVADVGPPPENLSVSAIGIKNGNVVATIHNSAGIPRDSRARLTIDGKPVGDAPLSIGPGQSAEILGGSGTQGMVAAVTIDDPDGIQADNTRFALLENTARPSVLLVASTPDPAHEAFYVQQALRAAAVGDETRGIVTYTLTSAADVGTWTEDRLRPYAAIVLLSTRGLERRGRELLAAFARAGGGILIVAGPDIDGDVAADVLGADTRLTIATDGGAKPERRALAPADIRHPIFQAFRSNPATLALVGFQRVARIQGSGCRDIARFTSGEIAILDCTAGGGRALVFASDLDARWNDFPLHPTFVPFLHQSVRYLAGTRSNRSEYLVGELPANVPRRPGAVLLPQGRGQPARRVVVNVDPREGEASTISADKFAAAVARVRTTAVDRGSVDAVEQEERQHLWEYLLAVMLTVLAVEGLVAARTV